MFEFMILIVAGIGAGIVTGLVGASAVVVVTPMLIAFLGMDPYSAIGISLATDVIASSISAYTYKRKGNINLKDGLSLAAVTVITALIGSLFSNAIPDSVLGGSTGIIILFMGISFVRKPLNEQLTAFRKKFSLPFFQNHKVLSIILLGTYIGLMTGVFGAGGGIMILMVLTFILGYSVHKGIGTSVLIMAFGALSGSVTHFIVDQHIPFQELLIVGIGAITGAVLAAHYANVASEERLSKVIGYLFILLGLLSIFT